MIKGGGTILNTQDQFQYFTHQYRELKPIDTELFRKYDVKRGLRDLNGKVCWPV